MIRAVGWLGQRLSVCTSVRMDWADGLGRWIGPVGDWSYLGKRLLQLLGLEEAAAIRVQLVEHALERRLELAELLHRRVLKVLAFSAQPHVPLRWQVEVLGLPRLRLRLACLSEQALDTGEDLLTLADRRRVAHLRSRSRIA